MKEIPDLQPVPVKCNVINENRKNEDGVMQFRIYDAIFRNQPCGQLVPKHRLWIGFFHVGLFFFDFVGFVLIFCALLTCELKITDYGHLMHAIISSTNKQTNEPMIVIEIFGESQLQFKRICSLPSATALYFGAKIICIGFASNFSAHAHVWFRGWFVPQRIQLTWCLI